MLEQPLTLDPTRRPASDERLVADKTVMPRMEGSLGRILQLTRVRVVSTMVQDLLSDLDEGMYNNSVS